MRIKTKVVLLFFIIILIIVCFAFNNKETKLYNSKVKEEFKIEKSIYYSSANAISNTTNYQSPEWNLNVYQYTDIAIYLSRLNSDNYITNVVLENFNTDLSKSRIYYLNPKDFGNSSLTEDNLIDKKLEYTVINSENKDNIQNYNIPVFFQDCSNPITLRIVTELSNNYKVESDETLLYNGTLIKMLGLGIKDLNKQINFDLIIKTRNLENKIEINLPIQYEENGKSILDGDIEIER